ncbi:MAG TPA: beta-ketoacyl synthase N-terminal-like domain-containing protein [Myxococcales bacterium]
MSPRAAITGWAWRTALGSDVETVWSGLVDGRRAARPCFRPGRVGAPLLDVPAPMPKHRRFLTPFLALSIQTALEAARRAGCKGGPRVALFAAVGGLKVAWPEILPAFQKISADGQGAWDQGLRELHPFWLLKHLSNNAHALASADLETRGEGATFGGANAGAQALCAALRCLADGAADAAIVMAADSLLGPEALVELESSSLLSRAALDGLAAPYDSSAAGFVPGEATAALVLEPESRAGSHKLALLSAAEGADGSPGQPRGELLARLAGEIGRGAEVVDGVGCAQAAWDRVERDALSAALGSKELPLTCDASALGQTGAARSLIQAMTLAAALRHGRLAPIAGLRSPAAGPLRPLERPEPTKARIGIGLSAGAPGLAGAVRVELP